MLSMLHTLAIGDGEIVQVLAVGGGLTVGAIYIVISAISSMSNTRAREATKREVAAYVAEGSISPDDARKIIESGDKKAEED